MVDRADVASCAWAAVDPFSFCMESCTLPTMVIARQHMWGVSPVGPYYLDKHGSTAQRVRHVRSQSHCNPHADADAQLTQPLKRYGVKTV